MRRASQHDEKIMEQAQADARAHHQAGTAPKDTPAGMCHSDAYVYRKWYTLTLRLVRELDKEEQHEQ